MNELFALSKHIFKKSFFTSLAENGFYETIFSLVSDPSPKVRLLVSGLLVKGSTEYTTTFFGTFMLSNPSHIDRIVELFIEEEDTTVKMFLADVILHLLDGREFFYNDQEEEFEKILSIFYSKGIKTLFSPLSTLKEDVTSSTESDSLLYHKLLELLCHFINAHGDHIKGFLINNSKTIRNSLYFLRHSDKQLALGVIKLIKVCIGANQPAYRHLIINNNLLEPIVKLYLDNAKSYNLINSAILDLFHYIKKENKSHYIDYFSRKLYPLVKDIEDVDIFAILNQQYLSNKEAEDLRESNLAIKSENQRFEQELEESSYFDNDDDDDPEEILSSSIENGQEEDDALFARRNEKRGREEENGEEFSKRIKSE